MIINIEKRKIYKFDLYEKTFKYLKNSFKQGIVPLIQKTTPQQVYEYTKDKYKFKKKLTQ